MCQSSQFAGPSRPNIRPTSNAPGRPPRNWSAAPMPMPRIGVSTASTANHLPTPARSTSPLIPPRHAHLGSGAAAAGQDDLAGADQLFDPVRIEHPFQRVDLLRVAGALDGEGPLADVDDLG